MAERKDGEETRGRILKTACKLFGKKGYRDTTVAEICKRARVNISSVNYYFGSKKSLYIETWREGHSRVEKSSPEGDVLLFSGPPEERLLRYIVHTLRVFGELGKAQDSSHLHMRELLHPTGFIDGELKEHMAKFQGYGTKAIEQLLGKDASRDQALFCETMIASQCAAILVHIRRFSGFFAGKKLNQGFIEHLARRIMVFSLGGIRAIREQNVFLNTKAGY